MIGIRSILAVTVTVLAGLYISSSNGSIQPLCTTWNKNISAVCSVITLAHNIMNTVVPDVVIVQNCAILALTPHCCQQFCQPAEAGTCDFLNSGACVCSGPGTPETCNAYFNAANNATDPKVLAQCQAKCVLAGGTCQTPAYINDGLNYLCVCYCPS